MPTLKKVFGFPFFKKLKYNCKMFLCLDSIMKQLFKRSS
jgi:hypothetical protein